MGHDAAQAQSRRGRDGAGERDDAGIAGGQAAAVLAAVDLDQKREHDVSLGGKVRRGRNDILRIRHQDQVGAGFPYARRMRELVRHDSGRIEDVAIARAREVLGLLQRRDRDARRIGRDARDIDRLRGFQMCAQRDPERGATRAHRGAIALETVEIEHEARRLEREQGVLFGRRHHASSRSGRSEVSMKSGAAPSCAGSPMRLCQ